MSKVTNLDEIFCFCKQKKEVGDYQTVSKILGITVSSVRTRFSRKDEKVVMAMHKMILQREEMIEEFQK